MVEDLLFVEKIMIEIKKNTLCIQFTKMDDLSLPCLVGIDKDKNVTYLKEDLKDTLKHDPKSVWLKDRLITLLSYDKESCEEQGAKIYTTLQSVSPHVVVGFHQSPQEVALLASGAMLRAWAFDVYKTQPDPKKTKLKTLTFLTSDPDLAKKHFEHHQAINEGNILTRHVVSEPPNVLFPESFAEYAKTLTALGLEVEVLGEAEMRALGFGALLGVGQGSVKQSQLVILSWKGGKDAPIAIVGKGVTFDTGGISIKPSNNMEDMKYDMAGSGVVLGLLKTLALRKAPVNVIGVMGMVENMPSGTAQRPSDIVTSLSGQTIEVVNTDAEGRLVLADALWYTNDRFKPKAIVDLATLTGAVVVALGHEYAGLMTNDEKLAKEIAEAGLKVDEKVWRLPLSKIKEGYDKDIDSDIADMKNVGSGRGAGTITAAQFLQRFVGNTPWVHLDIAGTAWEKKSHPQTGKGATGFGVRLLNQWLEMFYE